MVERIVEFFPSSAKGGGGVDGRRGKESLSRLRGRALETA
jgi:hypothetical protein